MVNYPHNDLFNRGDTDRQLRIDFSGGTITNKEMHQGTFTLTESLCSESSLTFGACESSVLTFKVHNVLTPLAGEELTVYEVLNSNTAEPFNYGKYKVQSDKPTADRKYRDVVAYDAMYDILNADVASWYNSLTFPCSIGYFRKKFLDYLKVDYVDTELVNDGIYIQKTIDAEELSGKQVINAICEINGCFGHINRQGKFQYVVLKPISTGLYPSETIYPSETLYPRESNAAELLPTSRYSSCKYEDFQTQFITGVQIRQEEDDIGASVGTSKNMYIVEDNFLVYGKNHAELTTIANNLLSVIDNIYYRPIEYVKTSGKPYLEVGDNISVGSSEVIIETYILERTITAVKGQRDEFSAKGTLTYPKELNGLNRQITQLRGRTNKLIRTVDETRSEIENLEEETNTRFLQTSEEISAEASRAEEAEASLKLQADGIALSVDDLEKDIGAQIELLTGEISLKVNAEDVINEINISDEAIVLSGNRLIVNSTNFQLDANGNVTVTGEINADSGKIGALEINGSGFSLGDMADGSSGYLSLSQISISEVWSDEIHSEEINVSSIYSASSGTVEIKDSLSVSGDLDVSGGIRSEYFYPDSVIANYISSDDIYGKNIECDYINNGVPITSENYWLYAPAIEITTHQAGGYGSYYYGTDSPYASGDNKSIPSIQWVKDYVNSKLSS